jgi:cell division protein FtsW
MLFIAGARPVYLVGTVGLGAMMFFIATLNSDYRRRRLAAFLNPWADPQGNGFQSIQSFISFHSGHFSGLGLGNGNSKLFYLPEVHTDFIFAMIGEELGFIGAAIVIISYAYLGYLLFKIVRFAPDAFGRYLAFGLALSLMLQIVVNLGGVTGLIPVKGLPLPFISWGRSAILVNLMMIGILLNIAKQSSIIRPIRKKATKPPPITFSDPTVGEIARNEQ